MAKILNLEITAKQDKGKNHYTLYMNGNNQSKRIIELLYNDANIYLDRKKDKADELIKYVEENPWIAWNKGLTLEDY